MVILRVSAKNYCFRFSEAKSCRIEILWKKEIADLISCWNTKKKRNNLNLLFSLCNTGGTSGAGNP
jgi:hypothetical protein